MLPGGMMPVSFRLEIDRRIHGTTPGDSVTKLYVNLPIMNTSTSRTIQPYLFFNGRCEEAIAFYRQALGAELQMMMRFNESPDPTPAGMLPPGHESKIMHASLRVGSIQLMLSDGCSSEPAPFSGFSLSLTLDSEAEVVSVFQALSEGGQVRMPPTKTFWSPCFGMVVDRFGVAWMVTVPPPVTA